MHTVPAGHHTRHRNCIPAPFWLLGQAIGIRPIFLLEILHIPCSRRRTRGIQAMQLGAVPQNGKTVAPNTARNRRSEEHTSELQSLMRISYAVFCLKKKKYIKKQNTTTNKCPTYKTEEYKNKQQIVQKQ